MNSRKEPDCPTPTEPEVWMSTMVPLLTATSLVISFWLLPVMRQVRPAMSLALLVMLPETLRLPALGSGWRLVSCPVSIRALSANRSGLAGRALRRSA